MPTVQIRWQRTGSLRALALFLILIVSTWSASANADESEANALFVEAFKLVQQADALNVVAERVPLYQKAIARLDQIIQNYPTSTVGLLLLVQQPIGTFDTKHIREQLARWQTEISWKQCVDYPSRTCLLTEVEKIALAHGTYRINQVVTVLVKQGQLDDALSFLKNVPLGEQWIEGYLRVTHELVQNGDINKAKALLPPVLEAANNLQLNSLPAATLDLIVMVLIETDSADGLRQLISRLSEVDSFILLEPAASIFRQIHGATANPFLAPLVHVLTTVPWVVIRGRSSANILYRTALLLAENEEFSLVQQYLEQASVPEIVQLAVELAPRASGSPALAAFEQLLIVRLQSVPPPRWSGDPGVSDLDFVRLDYALGDRVEAEAKISSWIQSHFADETAIKEALAFADLAQQSNDPALAATVVTHAKKLARLALKKNSPDCFGLPKELPSTIYRLESLSGEASPLDPFISMALAAGSGHSAIATEWLAEAESQVKASDQACSLISRIEALALITITHFRIGDLEGGKQLAANLYPQIASVTSRDLPYGSGGSFPSSDLPKLMMAVGRAEVDIGAMPDAQLTIEKTWQLTDRLSMPKGLEYVGLLYLIGDREKAKEARAEEAAAFAKGAYYLSENDWVNLGLDQIHSGDRKNGEETIRWALDLINRPGSTVGAASRAAQSLAAAGEVELWLRALKLCKLSDAARKLVAAAFVAKTPAIASDLLSSSDVSDYQKIDQYLSAAAILQ